MISAISVKDRLKNQAAAGGKAMQEALIAYVEVDTDSAGNIKILSFSQWED